MQSRQINILFAQQFYISYPRCDIDVLEFETAINLLKTVVSSSGVERRCRSPCLCEFVCVLFFLLLAGSTTLFPFSLGRHGLACTLALSFCSSVRGFLAIMVARATATEKHSMTSCLQVRPEFYRATVALLVVILCR